MNQSLPLLTPLQGIAALMVVLFHARLLLFPSGWSRSPATPNSSRTATLGRSVLYFERAGAGPLPTGRPSPARPAPLSYGRFLWLRLTRVYPSTW